MPCEPQCPMIRINFHLKILLVKEKIATIRQIICVTKEIGIQPMISPNQRNEVTSSLQQQLEQKLVEAMTRLVNISDEIATGCAACRTN